MVLHMRQAYTPVFVPTEEKQKGESINSIEKVKINFVARVA